MKIVVGLGTCGIAAGAEHTYSALAAATGNGGPRFELEKTGCLGMCYQEPLVEVRDDAGHTWHYGGMTKDRVARLLEEHVAGGAPVAEWLVRTDDGRRLRNGVPRQAEPHRAAQLRRHQPGVDRRLPGGRRGTRRSRRCSPSRTPTR